MGVVDVRLDRRTWLSSLGAFGDLEVKHGPNGPLEATWAMALRTESQPPALVRKALVEVFDGPTCVWAGRLGQPNWSDLTFAAIGIARQGEQTECLASSGVITSKPNTVIDNAIARQAVDWIRVSNFGDTNLAGPDGDASNDDPEPGKLGELLDLWAEEKATRWYVHPDRRLVRHDPVESNPRWLLLPGVGVLGVADDDVTDQVFLRYRDSGVGRIRTAIYPTVGTPGGMERRASVTARGGMTAARALLIAEGMWRKAQAGRAGWTNGLEVGVEQVTTMGGQHPRLSQIRSGQAFRMQNTTDPRNGRRSLDFIAAETVWRPGEGTVQITPEGMVARTWDDILADYRAEAA